MRSIHASGNAGCCGIDGDVWFVIFVSSCCCGLSGVVVDASLAGIGRLYCLSSGCGLIYSTKDCVEIACVDGLWVLLFGSPLLGDGECFEGLFVGYAGFGPCSDSWVGWEDGGSVLAKDDCQFDGSRMDWIIDSSSSGGGFAFLRARARGVVSIRYCCCLLFLFLFSFSFSFSSKPTSQIFSCLDCHFQFKFEHANLSCIDCHLGKERAKNKETAHTNLRPKLTFSEIENLCKKCHSEEINKFKNTLHYTYEKELKNIFKGFQLNLTFKKMEELAQVSYDISTKEGVLLDFLRRRCLTCHIFSEGENYKATKRALYCFSCHKPHLLKKPTDKE
ncbi:MAG: hypothetical protein ACK419_07155, partial [Pyrinomonadaceae bacterium]